MVLKYPVYIFKPNNNKKKTRFPMYRGNKYSGILITRLDLIYANLYTFKNNNLMKLGLDVFQNAIVSTGQR